MQQEAGERLRDDLTRAGQRAIYLSCDVSSPSSVEQAIAATIREFGRLDIVFANAGINGVWAPIDELQPEEWERTHAINLKGTYLTMRPCSWGFFGDIEAACTCTPALVRRYQQRIPVVLRDQIELHL